MDIIVQNAIKSQFESTEQFPVDFDVYWGWIGYTRKDAAKRAFESADFEKGVDYHLHSSVEVVKRVQGGGSQPESIFLTIDCAKSFAMMAKTEKGKEVRKYYLECEKIAKSIVPVTYLDALKALVVAEEAKELLKIQNQELEHEVEQLSEAVDDLFNFSSIIRIAKFNNVCETNFKWRTLKAASQAKNLEVKQVPCPQYKTKNLYHHDVWRYCYPTFNLPETTTLTIVR